MYGRNAATRVGEKMTLGFDPAVHKLLHDLGGDTLAPSLARALKGSGNGESCLVVVNLPEDLHSFLVQRTGELNQVLKTQRGPDAPELCVEKTLQLLVSYYANQAMW